MHRYDFLISVAGLSVGAWLHNINLALGCLAFAATFIYTCAKIYKEFIK